VRAVSLVIASIPLLLSGCLGGGSVESSTPTTAARRVVVPRVEPGYVQDAARAIRAAGLRVVILSVPPISGADASVNGYAVQSQSPASGSRVPAGSPVVLRIGVSLNAGPGGVGPMGVVPNLVGMPVNVALSAAYMVGLHVTVSGVTHQVPSDAVTAQSIAPDTPVEPDAVITLTLG
jgi:beta-lactam-binding protein with PASTA domain